MLPEARAWLHRNRRRKTDGGKRVRAKSSFGSGIRYVHNSGDDSQQAMKKKLNVHIFDCVSSLLCSTPYRNSLCAIVH